MKNFYFCMTNTLRRTQNLNLWCLDVRSGCHAAKILAVGVCGTKNVWYLSSL